MDKSILEILSLDLTKEQKEALLGKLANEIIKENQNDNKTFEEKRGELIEKSRKEALENKKRVEQYNRDADIKYKGDVLTFLKHPTKDYPLFNKNEIDSMTGYEIESNYELYTKNYPEAIEKAKEEYANRNTTENKQDSKKEDKELETQIFEDNKQESSLDKDNNIDENKINEQNEIDFNPMMRNDFDINELEENKSNEEKVDEVDFDPMTRNDLDIEEQTNENQEEQDFDPMARNTELDNLDLESDAAKKATEDVTPEAERKLAKITTAQEGLKSKIINNVKKHKIGLIGIAASVALVLANPGIAAAVGLTAIGADAVKSFNAGRKA